jgi:branched-chain amino acid transport system permease protein
MERFLQQLINGLMLGSTYSLLAIGYTLVFGLLQMLNMAHGEVYMMAAFLGWVLVVSVHLPFYAALIVASLLAGCFGLLIQFFCFRLVKKEYPLASLLSTIGLGIILQNIALVFSKGEMVRFPDAIPEFTFHLGNLVISGVQILILVISLVLMLFLQWVIFRTAFGKSTRAISENAVIASMFGINTQWIQAAVFFISSSLAGIAGVLTALAYHSITPFMGVEMGLKGLTCIVLGGMGSTTGAMLGGILLGLGEVAAMAYLPMELTGYKESIAFIILILILLFKPSGLSGKFKEEKV